MSIQTKIKLLLLYFVKLQFQTLYIYITISLIFFVYFNYTWMDHFFKSCTLTFPQRIELNTSFKNQTEILRTN